MTLKTISGGSDSIQIRMRNMVFQLESNQAVFLGSVIDLEDQLHKQAVEYGVCPVELRESITVEELSDDAGYLLDSKIEETVWLASLSAKSGLDCRMIHNFSPIKELGLYPLTVTVNVEGNPVVYSIKLWVVPAAS